MVRPLGPRPRSRPRLGIRFYGICAPLKKQLDEVYTAITACPTEWCALVPLVAHVEAGARIEKELSFRKSIMGIVGNRTRPETGEFMEDRGSTSMDVAVFQKKTQTCGSCEPPRFAQFSRPPW